MTIDQLIAAIERRGYIVQMHPPREGYATITIEIYRNNGPIPPGISGEVRSVPVSMLVTAPSIGAVAETFASIIWLARAAANLCSN